MRSRCACVTSTAEASPAAIEAGQLARRLRGEFGRGAHASSTRMRGTRNFSSSTAGRGGEHVLARQRGPDLVGPVHVRHRHGVRHRRDVRGGHLTHPRDRLRGSRRAGRRRRSSSSSVTARRASRARCATSSRLMPPASPSAAAVSVVSDTLAESTDAPPPPATAFGGAHPRHDSDVPVTAASQSVRHAVARVLPAAPRAARPPRCAGRGRVRARHRGRGHPERRRHRTLPRLRGRRLRGRAAARPPRRHAGQRGRDGATGVQVESIRPYAGQIDPHRELELLEALARDPASSLAVLADGAARVFRAGWALVLAARRAERRGTGLTGRVLARGGAAPERRGAGRCPGGRRARRVSSTADAAWAPADWQRLGTELAVSPLGDAALLVGRPALRWLPSELVRLQHLAAIAATVTQTHSAGAATGDPLRPLRSARGELARSRHPRPVRPHGRGHRRQQRARRGRRPASSPRTAPASCSPAATPTRATRRRPG